MRSCPKSQNQIKTTPGPIFGLHPPRPHHHPLLHLWTAGFHTKERTSSQCRLLVDLEKKNKSTLLKPFPVFSVSVPQTLPSIFSPGGVFTVTDSEFNSSSCGSALASVSFLRFFFFFPLFSFPLRGNSSPVGSTDRICPQGSVQLPARKEPLSGGVNSPPVSCPARGRARPCTRCLYRVALCKKKKTKSFFPSHAKSARA